MLEKDIEKYLVKRVKEIGGKAYKWVSTNYAGVPDRIVFLPRGKIIFVELKAPGKVPTALQELRIKELRDLGNTVMVLDSKQGVDLFIDWVTQKVGGQI